MHQAGAALSVTNIMVSLSALTIVYRYLFLVPDSVSHAYNLMTLELTCIVCNLSLNFRALDGKKRHAHKHVGILEAYLYPSQTTSLVSLLHLGS